MASESYTGCNQHLLAAAIIAAIRTVPGSKYLESLVAFDVTYRRQSSIPITNYKEFTYETLVSDIVRHRGISIDVFLSGYFSPDEDTTSHALSVIVAITGYQLSALI